jgi:uncharacterized membrane protein YccC
VNPLAAALSPAGRIVREVAAALRQDLPELKLVRGRARQCAQAAFAVALATTAALVLQLNDAWWAAISAFVCTQATAPASLQRGLLRILGTAIGAGLALLLAPLLAEDTPAITLALFAVSTLGVLGLQVSPHGYAWLLGAITTDMVLLSELADPHSALSVACNRTAEVIIGTIAAMLVAIAMAADPNPAATQPAAPGWADPLGVQWPSTRHALRAGIGVMAVPWVWNWLELPSLSQAAVTVAAVMALPALSHDDVTNQRAITERALHRLLGCLLGGVAGLACLALSVDMFIPWLTLLTAGIFVSAHVQNSPRGIGYVGIQAAVVFITMMIQNAGPPNSLQQGIERFAGIIGGLLILLSVSLLTAPFTPNAEQDRTIR